MKTLAIASVVLMVGSLTACGGDDSKKDRGGDTAAYCGLLNDAKGQLDFTDPYTNLGQDNLDQLINSVPAIEAAAPDDVKDDWSTLLAAFSDVNTALSDAGITLDDVPGFINQTALVLPEGMDKTTARELLTELEGLLENADVDTAAAAVVASAKDDCDITIFPSPADTESSPADTEAS